MSRLARALLVAAAALCVMAPAATAATSSATAGSSNQLGSMLGELWTTVLQTPTPDNPFTGGSTCVYLPDGQLAPFGPNGAGPCTVQRGTKIFVAARSQECSTFAGDDCDGATYSRLLANAQALDAKYTTHTVAVDGRRVPVTEVVTRRLNIVLPEDNVFGLSGRAVLGVSAAHGWVVLLPALPRGRHAIDVHLAGEGFDSTITTRIIVL
jgi:hypothetical protein